VLIPHAANFVVYLPSPDQGQLLVADNYNPFVPVPNPDVANQTQVVFRKGFMAKLSSSGEFNKLGWQPHKAPNSVPGGDYSLSALHYGEPAATPEQDDSLAEWYWDAKEHAIVVRLSWAKLLITDPSGTQALLAYSPDAGIRTTTSNEIEISVFTLKQDAPGGGLAASSVVSSLPPDVGNQVPAPATFMFKRWNTVKMDPYRKKAYLAVQQMFAPAAPEAAHSQPRSRAAVAKGNGAVGQ
jgi:hypothetical protein